MPHVGQGYDHGLEEAEDRWPFLEFQIPFGGVDQHTEVDDLVSVESSGMIHADGPFLWGESVVTQSFRETGCLSCRRAVAKINFE